MYNNYSIYSYIENKQVQRIYHRLFGSKPKEKRKEYTIQNKSSNNKEITNQLSGGKQKKKRGCYTTIQRIYIENNIYRERKRNTI